MRFLAGWIFSAMSFAIPVKRLRETKNLLAFYHPQPSYPLHILLVPKKALDSLSGITTADAAFMVDLFETVKSLVEEYELEETGYRLIANGGKYQDFPQLHFHLIADKIPGEG